MSHRFWTASLLLLASLAFGCDRATGVTVVRDQAGTSTAASVTDSDGGNGLEPSGVAPPVANSFVVPEPGPADQLAGIEYVIAFSIDGLATRFVDKLIADGQLPTFRQLQAAGAWTHHARCDYTYSVTLPNHTTMLTGRPVTAVEGMPETTHHGYTSNMYPAADATLHNTGNPALSYVASIFDVAHDFGLKTCLYAGKDKFVIFTQSYAEDSGAPDLMGTDNGTAKIDVAHVIHNDSPQLFELLLNEMATEPCNLAFFHVTDTDPGGHAVGWGSAAWLDIVRRVDGWLARVYSLVANDPTLRGRTAILLTADHGGTGFGHSNALDPFNYTVPFYVVAPGISGGTDLYSLVPDTRFDPGDTRPSYADEQQPVRNGDIGNLALDLLRLPPIPGSLMYGMGLTE